MKAVLTILHPLLRFGSILDVSYGRNECYAGTRLKVLTDIEEWVNSDDSRPVLCLSCQPGSGKTTIAVSVSKRAGKKSSNKMRFAGFFCSSLSEEASNPNNIIPTLAAQFAAREDVYPVFKDELGLHRIHDSEKKRHEKLLTRLLEEVSARTEKTLLVIDGLDEFPRPPPR